MNENYIENKTNSNFTQKDKENLFIQNKTKKNNMYLSTTNILRINLNGSSEKKTVKLNENFKEKLSNKNVFGKIDVKNLNSKSLEISKIFNEFKFNNSQNKTLVKFQRGSFAGLENIFDIPYYRYSLRTIGERNSAFKISYSDLEEIKDDIQQFFMKLFINQDEIFSNIISKYKNIKLKTKINYKNSENSNFQKNLNITNNNISGSNSKKYSNLNFNTDNYFLSNLKKESFKKNYQKEINKGFLKLGVFKLENSTSMKKTENKLNIFSEKINDIIDKDFKKNNTNSSNNLSSTIENINSFKKSYYSKEKISLHNSNKEITNYAVNPKIKLNSNEINKEKINGNMSNEDSIIECKVVELNSKESKKIKTPRYFKDLIYDRIKFKLLKNSPYDSGSYNLPLITFTDK